MASPSQGRYLVQNTSKGIGTATYLVTVPSTGTWQLSGLAIAPNGASNSFNVAWDSASAHSWALPDDLTSWTWATDKTKLKLTAGVHVLHLSMREAHTELDSLQLVRIK
jgi:hypothetical protein